MIIDSVTVVDGKIQIILQGNSDLDLRDYVALQQACKDKQNITLKNLCFLRPCLRCTWMAESMEWSGCCISCVQVVIIHRQMIPILSMEVQKLQHQ